MKKTAAHAVRKQGPAPRTKTAEHKAEASKKTKPESLDAVVYALNSEGDFTYAGTDHGLLRSNADGHSWEKVSSLELLDVRFLASHDQVFFAAGLKDGAVSVDGGSSWSSISLPSGLSQVGAVSVDDAGTLWMGGIEGVFYSKDHGATWQTLRALFLRAVNDIHADFAAHRVYVASSLQTYAFVVHVPDYKVTYTDTGWPLRFVRPVGDHLIAATLFEGTVVQPVMMDTPFGSADK